MKERDDQLEDLFRERFSEKEAPISPRVWNNIKNSLPPEGNKKKPFWKNPITFFAMVGGSLLTAAALWWLLSGAPKENDQAFSKELTVQQNTNSQNEKLTNGQEETTISKNANDKDSGKNIDHTNTLENNKMESNRPLDENNTSTDNDHITIKTNTAANDKSQTGRRDDIVGSGNLNNATNANQRYLDREKRRKERLINSGIQNEPDRSENMAIHNKLLSSNPDDQTKKNVSVSESSQEDGKGITNVAVEKDRNTARSSTITINDKDNNNHSTPVATTSNQKKKDLSSDIIASKEEEKNVTDLLQKNGEPKNIETIRESSTTDLKENEKLHELLKDSSLSSVQKEHAPIDQNNISDNSENGKEKSFVDSIAKAPIVTKVSPDSIQPVMDTTTAAKSDSTLKADSTDKKEKDKKEKDKKPKFSRWSFDLVLGPMLTGASTQANDLAYQPIVNAKNEQDKNLLNFSGGGMVNYAVSPKFQFSAGIIYSGYSEKYNFKNTKDSLVLGSHIEKDSVQIDQDTTGAPIYGYIERKVIDTIGTVTNEYSIKKKDQYSFISVPLNVSMYLWRRERLALMAAAGIRANLIMKNTTYITNREMTTLTEYSGGVQKITLSYMASVALEYQLKNKMYLLVQPAFNYQAGSIYTKSAVLNQKPYSVGVNVGLRIKL